MKRRACLILICLLAGIPGCAGSPPLGEPVDNAARRAALLAAWQRPEVSQAIFRTVIRWGSRELSLVEIVKPTPERGYSVAGITDVGNTLYAVQVDADGEGRVLSKSLPFSDRWLLEGPVTEVLIPWTGPAESSELRRLPDGTWALVDRGNRTTRMFVFDRTGTWRELRLLSGTRELIRASLEWNKGPVPGVVRVHNSHNHYHAVRENIPDGG